MLPSGPCNRRNNRFANSTCTPDIRANNTTKPARDRTCCDNENLGLRLRILCCTTCVNSSSALMQTQSQRGRQPAETRMRIHTYVYFICNMLNLAGRGAVLPFSRLACAIVLCVTPPVIYVIFVTPSAHQILHTNTSQN